MALLLVTDTETVNGFKEPKLVQVAAVLYNDVDDRIEAQIDAIIAPDDITPEQFDAEAVALHGITHERASTYGLPGAMVCNLFLRMVAQADEFLAYNESFDTRVMKDACAVYGLPNERLHNMRKTCVMRLAAQKLNGGTNLKLGNMYRLCFGTELAGAHGAFADARAALQIYRHLTRGQA